MGGPEDASTSGLSRPTEEASSLYHPGAASPRRSVAAINEGLGVIVALASADRDEVFRIGSGAHAHGEEG